MIFIVVFADAVCLDAHSAPAYLCKNWDACQPSFILETKRNLELLSLVSHSVLKCYQQIRFDRVVLPLERLVLFLLSPEGLTVPPVKMIVFVLLAILAAVFCAVWACDLSRRNQPLKPTAYQVAVGFFTDFLDTLGVGSFAVTTTLYRLRKTIPDELIPGTLNVGHCLPTITQAFIYIAIIDVEMRTLVFTILASVLGAWLGAGFVTQWPRQRIQRGMGLALLAAAGLILARLTHLLPAGGSANGLQGGYLAIALIGNFVFGALMMIGVGAYAPIMIMISLLGMNPTTAFPIMMGSCAFLMPVASIRIIRAGKYDSRAALGLTLAGIPGVLLAAFIVKELPLEVVRWLVVAVVIYTALSMLWAANRKESAVPSLRE